jgi:hypothetical protein
MKFLNILSLIIVVAIFQACDPLEEELNALDIPTTVVADLNYTLTDDDYDFVDKGFGTFDSEDEAKELIPDILTENYPQLGVGSSALIHYDLYDPIRLNNEVAFELTEADYEAVDQGFGTLSSDGDSFDAAELKHPNPENNDVLTLTYEWFCFGCPEQGTRTSKLTYYDDRWLIAFVPTSDDYTFMGQSFPNFSSRTAARERIGKLLTTRFLFDDAGDIRTSVFTYTFVDGNGDRQFVDFMIVFQFDGEAWQPFFDVVARSLQLGHDGNTWVPDNTIKYTLTGADYVAIADDFSSINPGGSSSMANFGNYDVGLWSDEEVLTSIGNRLLDIFPQVEDQKYLVSYDTWEPGAGVRSIHLIFKGGSYVLVE